MNKSIRRFVSGVVSVAMLWTGLAVPAWAQVDTNVCRDTGAVFAFFNGVQTTAMQASVAKEEFKRIHGDRDPSGEEMRYEVMYNYSAGFEDFVETFEQRLREQDGLLEGRFELFFEALSGDGPWWRQIINAVSATAGILSGFVDWYQAQVVRNLTTLFGNPPTNVNYAEHRLRIDNWVLEGKKLLFVAHSQGNLFANAAYTYAAGKVGAASVKLVHIAPASPSLNGSHTLADLDLVINGLRIAGSVAPITDLIPGYLLRPPGVNGQRDPLGHGLLEIYINQQMAISNRVRGHIQSALSTLVSPQQQASPGFFTATLTWNGSGDVDLHTFEPGGMHVYYAAPTGASGYLDFDNTVANGPEHYYASCDSTRLRVGTYRIAVANYARATGRTATVQIASWKDGVLGTKSVTLGGETRDNPAFSLFNVVVSRNAQTGKYSADIAP